MATNYSGMAKQFQDYFGGPVGGGVSNFNPYGSASQAQAFNLAGGENLSALSDTINAITRNAQTQANQARIPGAANLEAQSSANIGSELEGQLPADVVRQLSQQAAERGVAIGSPASPNSRAALLRALGLTSLDLTGRGQAELSAAYGRNPAAPIFDPSTQLITPYQGAQLGAEQTRLEQEYQNERDRLAMERTQLARQGSFGGSRGGGGEDQSGIQYVRQPFASDLQTTFVGGPTGSTGPTGALLGGGSDMPIWMNPSFRQYGTGTDAGTTTFTTPSGTTGTATQDEYDAMLAQLPGNE